MSKEESKLPFHLCQDTSLAFPVTFIPEKVVEELQLQEEEALWNKLIFTFPQMEEEFMKHKKNGIKPHNIKVEMKLQTSIPNTRSEDTKKEYMESEDTKKQYKEMKEEMNTLVTKLPHFGIAVDLEFSGSGPVRNQITEIGACLVDLVNNKVLHSFKLGPFHLDHGRVWEPGCRSWWDSIPEMKLMADKIDHKSGTVELRDGIIEFVKICNQWVNDRKDATFCWIFDTAINDPAHLAATLDMILGIRLSHFFGYYKDAINIDIWEMAAACVSGTSIKKLWAQPHYPVNQKPHDAESDARYIAEQLLFYKSVFTHYTNKYVYSLLF